MKYYSSTPSESSPVKRLLELHYWSTSFEKYLMFSVFTTIIDFFLILLHCCIVATRHLQNLMILRHMFLMDFIL